MACGSGNAFSPLHISMSSQISPVALLATMLAMTSVFPASAAAGKSGGKADPAEAPETTIYQSVLRIEAAAQQFDYRAPWNSGRYGGGSGTGFVVGENRILTNAHVVSNSRRLLIRKHGDPAVYQARLLHIAHDCDLALLELENPKALDGVTRLGFGDVPQLESEVRVIGYPVGGERLSVTRGVVSRIDFNTYSHSGVDQHLVVQIDAAINPGNSGGPVLQGDKVVGVAFQGLTQADNTGYMIPTPVVKRFLKDVEDGQYDHYVDLGFTDFELANQAQRAALGLPDDNRGILVASVAPGGSVDGKLRKGDIVMALDDHPVFSNGQVRMDGQMVNMHEVVERKYAGEKVVIDFLREGKKQRVEATLSQFEPARIFATEYETRPTYAVFGGLVFQPFSRNLLVAYGFESLEVRHLLERYTADALYQEREDLIMLTQVLPDAVNTDLASLSGLIVEEINGKPVGSLKDVIELLFAPMEKGELPEFIVIRCRGTERPLVLPGAAMKEAQARIRSKYGLARDHLLEGRAGEGLNW